MGEYSSLGFADGYNRRKREIRQMGLEDADRQRQADKDKQAADDRDRKLKLEDEDRARQKTLQERADAEYERTQRKRVKDDAAADAAAQEEGLFGLAEDLDAGIPLPMALDKYNRVGTLKADPAAVAWDPEKRTLTMPDDDGTTVQVPVDALLTRKRGPKKLYELGPGEALSDADGNIKVRNRDKPPAPTAGGAGDPPKPPTRAQLRLAEKDAADFVVSSIGGKWDNATEKLVDATPEITQKFTVVAPIISKLTTRYGDRMGPREIGDLVLRTYGTVKSLPEYEAEAEAEAPKGRGPFNDFEGSDSDVRASFKQKAKVKRDAALALAKQTLDAELAALDETGGGAPAAAAPAAAAPQMAPALQRAFDNLPKGKLIKLKDGTTIRKGPNGEPIISRAGG